MPHTVTRTDLKRSLLRAIASVQVVVLTGHGCSPCENELLEEIAAPGGAETAVVFYRTCGAPGPGGFQVSVLPAGHHLAGDRGGNTLDVAERPRLTWTSDSTLLISYPASADVRFQAIRLRQVFIVYDTK